MKNTFCGSCVAILMACVLLQVSAGEEAAPVFEDVAAVPLPVQQYGYRGMPGDIIELKDGTLLMAYTHMTPEGQADGAIGAKYSHDQGKTWGDEIILIAAPKPAGPDIYCHPSFLRLQNGEILFSYIYRSSMKPLFGHNYYRRSVDEGQTWSEQFIVSPHRGYNIMHNDKLVQLSSGRILAPLEHEFANPENDHAGYISYTMYSDDNGYSWWQSDNMVNTLPIEAQEPHVVELRDGRLMMLMRTYSGFVSRSYSEDKGQTWSEGQPVKELTLPQHTSSAINCRRIPMTGDLLLLRCNNGPQSPAWRTPFVSVISKDDGVTWENERVIMGAADNDYGYPSLDFVGDTAVISYHQRDGLHVLRIGVPWFYQAP